MRGYCLALNGRITEARSDADLMLRTAAANPYSPQLASLVLALSGEAEAGREVLRPRR